MSIADIKVNVNGVDKIIDEAKRLRTFDTKITEFLNKLGLEGIIVADMHFKYAQYDGHNDVVVDKTPIFVSPTEMAIRASGATVLFIEFGSGVHYAQAYPLPKPPGVLGIGEYGMHQGLRDWWLYSGDAGTNGVPSKVKPNLVYTHGNPPNNAMYFASKAMRASIARIAGEVFVR